MFGCALSRQCLPHSHSQAHGENVKAASARGKSERTTCCQLGMELSFRIEQGDHLGRRLQQLLHLRGLPSPGLGCWRCCGPLGASSCPSSLVSSPTRVSTRVGDFLDIPWLEIAVPERERVSRHVTSRHITSHHITSHHITQGAMQHQRFKRGTGHGVRTCFDAAHDCGGQLGSTTQQQRTSCCSG